MSYDVDANTYSALALWGPRAETADEIAARLRLFIDGLIQASPLFMTWSIGRKRARLYDRVRDDLTKVVAENISRDQWGVSPLEGYRLLGVTRGQPDDRTVSFSGVAGSVLSSSDRNYITFNTNMGIPNDQAIRNYTLFRSLVLNIAASWQPRGCIARSYDLIKHQSVNGLFCEAWIVYVAPDLAKTVDTGGVPVVEATPEGGLLLAATTEPFKTDDPVHFEGARKVALAVRHLNVGEDAEAPTPRPAPVPQKKAPLSALSPEVIAQMKEIFGDKWMELVGEE